MSVECWDRSSIYILIKLLISIIQIKKVFKLYINKLDVKNFRSLCNFSIRLKPKTLIIGENNVGKTNLLKALSLLLNNEIGGIRSRVLRLEDFNYDAIQIFKRDVANIAVDPKDIIFPKIEISATFTDFKDEEEKTIVSEWHTDETHKEAQLKFNYSCTLRNPLDWIIKIREHLVLEENHLKRVELVPFPLNEYESSIVGGMGNIKPENFQLRALKIDLLDALRDAKTELSASKENRLLYRILSNREQSKFDDILKSAGALNNSINKGNSELAEIKSGISKVLGNLSLETDTTSNEINFRFSDVSLQELLKKIGLEYGDKPISVENNGLGRNNLLFMSFVLSHIQSKQDNPDFRLIAIEEPEAHINPILQKHFSESVSDDNFFNKDSRRQVILTSHSTHICSHLDLENTVVMYKDVDANQLKSHFILDGIDDTADGKRTKNYLKKWLSATNSVMFFSRRIIFVEGIAEQILVPKFFELKYGVKPEKMNCQVVNVNGLAFRNFLEVVKQGYFIKVAALTDSDLGTKTAGRATELKNDFDSANTIVCITKLSTFEKELIDANATGKGAVILKGAAEKTRPRLFKEDLKDSFTAPINIDEIFGAIEDYKAEFAFNLITELDSNCKDFVVPHYIDDAFKFVCGEK